MFIEVMVKWVLVFAFSFLAACASTRLPSNDPDIKNPVINEIPLPSKIESVSGSWKPPFTSGQKFSARMGPGGSGGGTDVGLDFRSTLQSALANLSKLNPEISTDLKRRRIEPKIIVVQEVLKVQNDRDVQICVAVNEPATKTIRVNRAAWAQIKNPHAKEGLALHEYLSLLGIERTGSYRISGPYFSRFGLVAADAVKALSNPERAIEAVKAIYALNIQSPENAEFKVIDKKCGLQDDENECQYHVEVSENDEIYHTPGGISYDVVFLLDELRQVQQNCKYCSGE